MPAEELGERDLARGEGDGGAPPAVRAHEGRLLRAPGPDHDVPLEREELHDAAPRAEDLGDPLLAHPRDARADALAELGAAERAFLERGERRLAELIELLRVDAASLEPPLEA